MVDVGFDTGLSGKRILVVGAGPGIGRQTALTAATLGAEVGAVDLHEERAMGTVESLAGSGHRHFAADVTDARKVGRLGREVRGAWSGIDVLIDVVGNGGPAGASHELSVDDWDTQFAINLRQQFLLIREFLPDMIRRGSGAIVAISSINATSSSPLRAAYGASKAALDSLIRSVAIEGAPHRVRANSVRPGATLTPRRQHLAQGQLGALYRREIPLGSLGAAQDVANVAIFLASDLARHITGQHIVVDGGSTVRYSQPAGR